MPGGNGREVATGGQGLDQSRRLGPSLFFLPVLPDQPRADAACQADRDQYCCNRRGGEAACDCRQSQERGQPQQGGDQDWHDNHKRCGALAKGDAAGKLAKPLGFGGDGVDQFLKVNKQFLASG